ncbi:MAG: DUF4136 domain-containing protein [Planctomycetota bacterium]|jgi:hypothetical protein
MRGLGALLLLAACATDIAVRTAHEPQADFSQLETYGWLSRDESVDEGIDEEQLKRNVTRAVEHELNGRGFRKAAAGGTPDFWVGYHAVLERRRDVKSINEVYGYGADTIWTGGEEYTLRMDPGTQPEVYERVYHLGTLILDVADGKTKGLIWRASAKGSVDLKAPLERRRRRTHEAVRKMLAHFPPGAEKTQAGRSRP